jgi:hypothetical protein
MQQRRILIRMLRIVIRIAISKKRLANATAVARSATSRTIALYENGSKERRMVKVTTIPMPATRPAWHTT